MADWNDVEARRQACEEREQNAVQSLFNAIAYQPTPKQERQALSWVKHFAYETRSIDHYEQEQGQITRLERIGVQASIATYTDDSSFPVEYTLRYGPVQAVGPTMDLALAEFVDKLLKHVPVEQ